jgi:hypothetical protein
MPSQKLFVWEDPNQRDFSSSPVLLRLLLKKTEKTLRSVVMRAKDLFFLPIVIFIIVRKYWHPESAGF